MWLVGKDFQRALTDHDRLTTPKLLAPSLCSARLMLGGAPVV